MRERIIDIIQELVEIEDDDETVNNLISGGHLDSFSILSLVSQLESNFSIEIDFGEDLAKEMDSIDAIVKLVERSRRVT